jgi:hypothetical protein
VSSSICIELEHPKNLSKEPLHIETSCIWKFKELERDYNSLAMAPKRSLDEQKLILRMYERGNSYYESPIVLGISRRICHDIVGRFTMRDDLRDARSYERP